jgi:thiamine kinase-like enzyme
VSRTPVKCGSAQIPQTDLSPLAEILEQLAPRLGLPEGDPVPLKGGITNRNYVARLGGKSYVIRLPGKDTGLLGIDREAEAAANRCAARAGIAPEVAALLDEPPCLVTRFVEGKEMGSPELRGPAARAAVAAALHAVHDCAERLPIVFSSFQVVDTYAVRARARGAEVPEAFGPAREAAARIEQALKRDEDLVPCHNDLLAANFLHSVEGIRLVDWEYAGMGDRYFDLGNFAANNELGHDEEVAFLDAYFTAPSGAARLAALRLMRFMSDFREAMWGVLQGSLSDLDFDFAAYAAKHFDRLDEAAAEPRFEAWLEEASRLGAAG